MKSLTLPAIAAVVLAASVISIARSQPRTESTAPPRTPPAASFTASVAAVGLVEPRSENIAIGVPLSALVEEVLVTPGARVAAGTPLVRLDVRALVARRRQAEAEVAAREASVATAAADIDSARATLTEADAVLAMAESLPSGAARLSREEMTRRSSARAAAAARLAAAEAAHAAARAAVEAARAEVAVIETDIARSTVRAPIDGDILQVRVRPGEFAAAGTLETPLLVMGDVSVLHVRVDVDEHEASRIREGARAEAMIRGLAEQRETLTFVRFEPFVVPKKSLTGAATERVDTRVLQVIYRVENPSTRLFPGQQMDVFIAADTADRI